LLSANELIGVADEGRKLNRAPLPVMVRHRPRVLVVAYVSAFTVDVSSMEWRAGRCPARWNGRRSGRWQRIGSRSARSRRAWGLIAARSGAWSGPMSRRGTGGRRRRATDSRFARRADVSPDAQETPAADDCRSSRGLTWEWEDARFLCESGSPASRRGVGRRRICCPIRGGLYDRPVRARGHGVR
jgi:hypothetical protein